MTRVLTRTQCVPHSLALDASHLYWTSPVEGELRRVSCAGGEPEVLARWPKPQGSPGALALDETHVWVGLEGLRAIARVPSSGGEPELLLQEDSEEWPVGLALDEEHVYWTSMWGSPNRLRKTGGPRVELAFDEPSPSYLHRVAVEGGQVYWGWSSVDEVKKPQRDGTLRTCDLLGENARDLVPRGTQPHGFAVRGAWLYFANQEREVCSLHLPSGEPKRLARGRTKAVLVGVDEAAVYLLCGAHFRGPRALERLEIATGLRTTLTPAAEGCCVAIGPPGVAWYEQGALQLLPR